MLKKISNKRLRVFVIILLLALIVFTIYSASWFYFYYTKAKPLIKNIDIAKTEMINEDGASYYSWSIDNGELNFYLTMPDFLHFHAGYSVLTPTMINNDGIVTNKYSYGFYYDAYLKSDSTYYVCITDYSNSFSTNKSVNEGVIISNEGEITYDLYFDKDFNLIEGSDELYNEHKKEIDRLFENSKEVLGEDAFK